VTNKWTKAEPTDMPQGARPDEGLMRENCNFGMVWTKSGHNPRFIHDDVEAAMYEAERLAKQNPGKKYIVLAAIMKISAPAAPAAATPRALSLDARQLCATMFFKGSKAGFSHSIDIGLTERASAAIDELIAHGLVTRAVDGKCIIYQGTDLAIDVARGSERILGKLSPEERSALDYRLCTERE
jgi:hypothetical protein